MSEFAVPFGTKLSELEKQYILAVCERCAWNKRRSAFELGISQATLRTRLILYGVLTSAQVEEPRPRTKAPLDLTEDQHVSLARWATKHGPGYQPSRIRQLVAVCLAWYAEKGIERADWVATCRMWIMKHGDEVKGRTVSFTAPPVHKARPIAVPNPEAKEMLDRLVAQKKMR